MRSVELALATAMFWSVGSQAAPFSQPESEWSEKLGPLKIKISQSYVEFDDLVTAKVTVYKNGPKVGEKSVQRHSSGGTAGFVRLKTQPLPGVYVLPIDGDEMRSLLLIHEDGKMLEYEARSTWKLTDSIYFGRADDAYSFIDLKDFKFIRQELNSKACQELFAPGVSYTLKKLNGKFYAVPAEEGSEFIEDAKAQIAAGKGLELDPTRGSVKKILFKAKDLAGATTLNPLY